jgi:hypothetical protein
MRSAPPPAGDHDRGTARPVTRSGRTVVTHPRTVATRVARDSLLLPDIEARSGLSELALQTLMRKQLRMGLRYLAVIVFCLIGVPLALVNSSVLAETTVFSIPLSWLVVGGGFFPLLLGVAVSYTRSIAQLEAAYLQVLQSGLPRGFEHRSPGDEGAARAATF